MILMMKARIKYFTKHLADLLTSMSKPWKKYMIIYTNSVVSAKR